MLDLFCGAGGCTKGYQQAGFRVLGVDHKRQPRYCGDAFIQADALVFLCSAVESGFIHQFSAAHASPPCQAHTVLKNMWKAKKHLDLIPQTRALLIESGLPFVMENVPGAPLEDNPLFGAFRIMLCGTMFGLKTDCGAELQRHRFFELNWQPHLPPPCNHGWAGVVGVHGGHARERRRIVTVTGHNAADQHSYKLRRTTITVTGATPQQNVIRNQERRTFTVEDAQTAMGINWMGMAGLSQAIPPKYTEWIGLQLMAELRGSK